MSYRTFPNEGAGEDPGSAAESTPELSRAERERDAAHAARSAAESARGRAEDAREAAESAMESARECANAEIEHLQEDVAFLREQLRSMRAHVAEALEPELADLHAERDSLLQEMGTLEAELQGRAGSKARRSDGRRAPHDDAAGRGQGDPR